MYESHQTHMGNMVEGGGGGGRVIDPCSRPMSSAAEMQDHLHMNVMKMGSSIASAVAAKDSHTAQSAAHNDTEYESRSGSDNLEGGGSGDELLQDAEAQGRPSKKRYHRHTLHQINEMERYVSELSNLSMLLQKLDCLIFFFLSKIVKYRNGNAAEFMDLVLQNAVFFAGFSRNAPTQMRSRDRNLAGS